MKCSRMPFKALVKRVTRTARARYCRQVASRISQNKIRGIIWGSRTAFIVPKSKIRL